MELSTSYLKKYVVFDLVACTVLGLDCFFNIRHEKRGTFD